MSPLLAAALVLFGSASADTYLDRARALMGKTPLIDGHNDLPWSFRRGGGNTSRTTNIREHREGGQTDIPRLREGRVGGQFWSVYVPTSLKGEEAVRMTREQIGIVYDLCRRYSDTFEIAWSADDVERIFKSGRIASMAGMEGGHSIDNSLKTLREMYELGARYMTLTHSQNTPWADSATDEPKNHGLDDFGRQVVREMNRLGMLVDLSHVSAETMHDVLDIAKAPVIFSHSGARGVCDNPRNVPDDVLRRLKSNGGVVMVVIFRPYVSQAYSDWSDRRREAVRGGANGRDWEAKNPPPKVTLVQVADHIDHIRRVAGIDHIGIGSDFDGGGGVDDLDDVSTYPLLIAELLRRGYSDQDVNKILGLNVLRVMRAAERERDREARLVESR